MNLHGLAPLCIPINKTGKQAKDFPKMVEAGFASDDQLIMFPAGFARVAGMESSAIWTGKRRL